MRLLGAILAGGRSSRFGSDKAVAMLDGRPLLTHVADALGAQCAEVGVVGRYWPGLTRIEDRPQPGLGPLGGLAGALAYAAANGFDAVLTSACDIPGLPRNIGVSLGEPDAVVEDQPTIGLWRASLLDRLDRFIATDTRRSIRGWTLAAGARHVTLAAPILNVNRPEDLAAVSRPADPRSSR